MIRILHVDDEDDIREVAALSLGLDPEIEVRSVASGTQALAVLADGGWRPDLILLDVMMPDLDGPGTLKAIHAGTDHGVTPVIFMTARTQSDERQGLIDLGAVGVIVKPFDPMTLAAEVRALAAG